MATRLLHRGLLVVVALGVIVFALTVAEQPQQASADGYGHVVGMYDNYFWPNSITVPTGGTVTWGNYGQHHHTTTSVRGRWDSGVLDHGDTFSVRFLRQGDYYYYCRIHPNVMRGVVHVRDTGYTTPTNADVTISVTIMRDGTSNYGSTNYGSTPGYGSMPNYGSMPSYGGY